MKMQILGRAPLAILMIAVASLMARADAPQTPDTIPTQPKSTPAQAKHRPYQDLHLPEALIGKTFDLTLHKASRSFWKGAVTATYAYNNEDFWGPTLIVNQGDTVQMNVKNSLDEETTTHWHGLHLPAAMDGGPHQIIAPGQTWSPSFTVKNNAGTYWYHPHAHGTTQKQLTYGAGGFLIVRDAREAALPLPRTYGVDDIPLALTSRRFYKNDQFSFEGDNDKYGDYAFANGVLDAQVSLPAQFVRLRILNVETERGYNIGFSDNRTYYLIATDGGLIDKPLPLKRMKLMTGERAEILVDLGRDKVGSSLDLMAYNSGQTFGFPGQEPGLGRPNGGYLNNRDFSLLHINVAGRTTHAITQLPGQLSHNRYWSEQDVTNRRTVKITGGFPGTNFSFDDAGYAMHAINQTVKLGAVEEWTIENNQVFGHAFHIHDVQFNIVSRSSGEVADYERGWKDTLYVPRNETVTFIAKFEDYASDTEPYMYHCHMSNHEDGGLMGQFVVVNGSGRTPTASGAHTISFREQKEHSLTEEIERTVAKQAGTVAPAFTAMDLEGKSVSLASLTDAKPLVLFFVELSCPCSRDAAPFLDRIKAQYGDACNVVGVINAQAEDARAWAKQAGVRFTLLPDPDQHVIRAYGAERSVYITLVAPNGRIVKTYPGYSQATLTEISARIAVMGGVQTQSAAFAAAPNTLVVGCPFPAIK